MVNFKDLKDKLEITKKKKGNMSHQSNDMDIDNIDIKEEMDTDISLENNNSGDIVTSTEDQITGGNVSNDLEEKTLDTIDNLEENTIENNLGNDDLEIDNDLDLDENDEVENESDIDNLEELDDIEEDIENDDLDLDENDDSPELDDIEKSNEAENENNDIILFENNNEITEENISENLNLDEDVKQKQPENLELDNIVEENIKEEIEPENNENIKEGETIETEKIQDVNENDKAEEKNEVEENTQILEEDKNKETYFEKENKLESTEYLEGLKVKFYAIIGVLIIFILGILFYNISFFANDNYNLYKKYLKEKLVNKNKRKYIIKLENNYKGIKELLEKNDLVLIQPDYFKKNIIQHLDNMINIVKENKGEDKNLVTKIIYKTKDIDINVANIKYYSTLKEILLKIRQLQKYYVINDLGISIDKKENTYNLSLKLEPVVSLYIKK